MQNVVYVNFRLRVIDLKDKRLRRSRMAAQFADIVGRVTAAGVRRKAERQAERDRVLFGVEKRARDEARQRTPAPSVASVIPFLAGAQLASKRRRRAKK